MMFENPPSRLRERREEHQASDTATTARRRYALPRHVADSPNRETARPLTTLGGIELETDVVSDRYAAERATMGTGSSAAKVLVRPV